MPSSFDHFADFVRKSIPDDRGWAWTLETVVECYERAAEPIADSARFTLACVELRRQFLARHEHLWRSSSFADSELKEMFATISSAIAADNPPNYRVLAYDRLTRDFPKYSGPFGDLMESEIEPFDNLTKRFVRFGVYALWRYDNDGHLRSRIPTYVGKAYRKAGLFDRIGEHWHWWGHDVMGVTITEVDTDTDQPKLAVGRIELAMIRAIRPPGNWKDWRRYE